MEINIILALGILFIGISTGVLALNFYKPEKGPLNIQAKNATADLKKSLMVETTVKILDKAFSDKRILVGINLVVLILALIVEKVTAQFPALILVIAGVAQIALLVWVTAVRRKIKLQIENKLPDVLDILARVYRVHTDLKVAFDEVATHSDDIEVKKLFREISNLARFGLSLEEALIQVAGRIKSDNFDFMVTTITLNTPIGGNLAAILENTAKILRGRKEASDEIKNLMFQSKFSSVAVGVLVPLIAAGSLIGSKNTREVLLFTPNGRLMFAVAMIWWLIGVIIVKRSTEIQI